MFSSLYSKLAAVLTVLFGLVGLLFLIVTLFSTDMYQQEVNQQLNSNLAEHIVKERILMEEGKVNEKALKDVFHMLMVINPSIELYLLDNQGEILAFSAPPGKVKRKYVDLEPIKQWLARSENMPILGDDPRNPAGQKVFTAAQIPDSGKAQGYVYVILGGERYDSIVQKLKRSHILRLSAWMIGASVLFALLTGLLLFASLTGRLKKLARVMDGFKPGEGKQQIQIPITKNLATADEIERLGTTFTQMAEHIELQMEELVKSDSLRRDLIANVSHDLRTPLATLQGYIETLLLKDDSLSSEDRQEYLEIAIKHCDHLGNLVDRLLELAKLDSPSMNVLRESFNLAELVQDVVQKFRLKIDDKAINFSTELQEPFPFVNADIGLMERALENLIENAIHYTPNQGAITLRLHTADKDVTFQITDTGPGIPKAELSQIFNRFYQLDKSRKIKPGHSGLGLAITKRILELHDKTIRVSSVVDSGTTFSFDLDKAPD